MKLEEDCASMYNLGHGNAIAGKWNDAGCEYTKGGLCKSEVSPHFEQPPKLQTCEEAGKSDYLHFNGACYKWVSAPKSWDDAEADCKSAGAHLVSIYDDMEQAYVFTNAEDTQSWIGLTNKISEVRIKFIGLCKDQFRKCIYYIAYVYNIYTV